VAVGGKPSPLTPTFWFAMSMALLAGFLVAYPINWWLVAKGLKHGMATVGDHAPEQDKGETAMAHSATAAHAGASMAAIASMAALSIIAFGLAYGVVSVVRATPEAMSMNSTGRLGSSPPHE
jgi:hypothetical protein